MISICNEVQDACCSQWGFKKNLGVGVGTWNAYELVRDELVIGGLKSLNII